ncbi:MAG: hypothetical protein WCC74_01505 [Minisyncoccia bacterium]
MNESNNTNQQAPANNDKTMAIIAYIIFFIPLLAVKNRSQFLNYHTNQGAILFIIGLAGSIILTNILHIYFLSNIWGLIMFVFMILGIMNASKNEMKPLPIIGNLFTIIKS